MRCYALGSQTRAAEIIQAFSQGVKGDFIRDGHKYDGGDIALWGLLRGAKELRQQCKALKATYYAVDHAYIGREDFFRVTRNGFQQTEIAERPEDRWQKLVDRYRINVRDWRRGGRYVLVALSSNMSYEYFEEFTWAERTIGEIQRHTDRKCLTRKKGLDQQDLQLQLRDAWCVVTHTSMAAVDAVIAGVPVFVTGPSIARPMGLTDLSKIESPVFPERKAWFKSLAYAQFNLGDMKRGVVKPALDENPWSYDHYGY
jgi:hypothetical protein